MLNKTIVDGLRPYGIGEKIRALRLKKSMGLVQLGEHTGLSPALLSKIETGKLFPTLPTLLRIALVFSVGLDYFFADDRKRRLVAITRRTERLKFPERPLDETSSFSFECLDYTATERNLNAYLAEFQELRGKPRPHTHHGIEFLYMVEGELSLTVAGELQRLESGDSVYFDSNLPHSYARMGDQTCRAVVITMP